MASSTSCSPGLHRRGRLSTYIVALLAALLLALVPSAASAATTPAAAPPRQDSAATDVLLIHGFNARGKVDCSKTWHDAYHYMLDSGWTGSIRTFGYYQGDSHCYYPGMPGGSRNTSITDVARYLAKVIYDNYTSRNRPVNVIAHSMGGLVLRAALAGVEYNWPGFRQAAPKLYVPNAVTLGTPHLGANPGLTYFCGSVARQKQCQEMAFGSTFLRNLPRNPQSAMGTDWTLIGSSGDGVVPSWSATDAYHRGTWTHTVTFEADISHTQLRTRIGGHYDMFYYNARSSNPPGGHCDPATQGYRATQFGAAPVIGAKNAAYWAYCW